MPLFWSFEKALAPYLSLEYSQRLTPDFAKPGPYENSFAARLRLNPIGLW
jgi:hypothetical protein